MVGSDDGETGLLTHRNRDDDRGDHRGGDAGVLLTATACIARGIERRIPGLTPTDGGDDDGRD